MVWGTLFMNHVVVLFAAASFLILNLAAPATHADGPDYEGTIAYIQSGVNGTFAQESHCTFLTDTPASDGGTFAAGALSVVPTAISAREIRFECLKGEDCVASPSGDSEKSIGLAVHGDAHGMALALSRLIEMCSGGIH